MSTLKGFKEDNPSKNPFKKRADRAKVMRNGILAFKISPCWLAVHR